MPRLLSIVVAILFLLGKARYVAAQTLLAIGGITPKSPFAPAQCG
jgi:hypothetical protein